MLKLSVTLTILEKAGITILSILWPLTVFFLIWGKEIHIGAQKWSLLERNGFLCFFRMFQILKFTFFNVLLSLFDVLTDLSTCIFLWEEGHPAWALLTAFWMLMPFVVGVMDFFARWMTCVHSKLFPLQDHREMVEGRTAGLQHLQRICLGLLPWGCLSSSHGTFFHIITIQFPAFQGDDNAQPVEGQALVRPQLRAAQLSFPRLQEGARNHQWGRKGLLRGIRGWTEEILCLFSEINFHMAHVDSKAHNSLFLEQNVWQYRSRQIGALLILDLCKLFVLIAVSEILLLWPCKQISN